MDEEQTESLCSYSMDMDFDEKKPILNNGTLFFDHFNGLLWEICPLDKSHYCRKKEMKAHISECKQQFLKGPKKVECPFNPLHIVNLMEIAQHIMECENRIVQTNNLCDFEPKRETIEGVPAAPLNIALQVPNTWEDGSNPDKGYDAMDATKFSTVIRPVPPGLSKAKKKEWRARERVRLKSLAGETKEKPRASPYPSPDQIRNARLASKEVAAVKDDADMMGIIDRLSSANIADPRDSMMKRINARLKTVRLIEAKLKEEKLELQRQVEQYLASISKFGGESQIKIEFPLDEARSKSRDPRKARGNGNDTSPKSLAEHYSSRVIADAIPSGIVI